MDPSHVGSYTSYTTSQYQTSAQPTSYHTGVAPASYTATYETTAAPNVGYSYTHGSVAADAGLTGALAFSTYGASPVNFTSTTVPGISSYGYEGRTGTEELKKSSYAVTTPTAYTATDVYGFSSTQPASYTVSSTVPQSYTATNYQAGATTPSSYTNYTSVQTGGYHPEVEKVLKSYAGTSDIGVSHHTASTDPYKVWQQINPTADVQSYSTGSYSNVSYQPQPSSYTTGQVSYTTGHATPPASYTAQPTFTSTANYAVSQTTAPVSYTNTTVQPQQTAPVSYTNTSTQQQRFGTPEKRRDDTGLNIVVQRVQDDRQRVVQSMPNRPQQNELRQSVLSPYRHTMYPEFELVEDLPDRTHLIESINTFLQKSPAKESLLASPSRVSIKRQSLLGPAQIEVQTLLKEKYEDGSIYEGEGLRGKKHGKGRLTFADGRIFEGQFRDGKAEGNAVIYYKNGKLSYEGGVDGNLYQGQGVLQCETPVPFQGSYDPSNFGNIGNIWTKYEGEFRQGKKNGRGTLYLSNGEKYVGEFRDDKIDGRGEFHTKDGKVIRGYWENNRLTRTQ